MAFGLASHSIPQLCVGLGLLHCTMCWKATGFETQASNSVLIKTSLFYSENSAGCCDLHRDGCALDAANKA